MNSQGQWCTEPNQVSMIATNYFQELFTSSTPPRIEETLESVEGVVTSDMSRKLLMPYTATEVKQAVFQMHPSKESGPDDMSCLFF